MGRIIGSDIASLLTENTMPSFIKEHNLEGISYFIPTPECRVDNPPIGGTRFYTRVIEDGVGFPIHPFFCDVLDSYGIVVGQLTPLAWCHMAGMLLLWGDLYKKTPSLGIWHHIYRLKADRKKPGS